MPRALGTTVTLEPGEPLGRYDQYLLLSDVLFEAGKQTSNVHLEQLATSFGHDILNLAVLAGRLLWYEGVSPDVWRSHDLIPVSVDIETYFVMLQEACDVMADVIVTLAIKKKGQAPYDSFHQLKNWIARNPNRLNDQFGFVGNPLPWFNVVNDVRTKLVHRGGMVWVYTNRLQFQWSVHGEQWKGIRRLTNENFLLPELKSLTRALLRFSRRLARAVSEFTGVVAPRTHVINGVFVPALRHLFTYEVPHRSKRLVLAGKCLAACGDYAVAADIGYPDGFWWEFLISIAELFGNGPHNISVSLGPGDGVSGATGVFNYQNHLHGVLMYDEIGPSQNKWSEARTTFDSFVQAWGWLESAVLVGQTLTVELRKDVEVKPIVGLDGTKTASLAFHQLLGI
jgi:hypothetical protein